MTESSPQIKLAQHTGMNEEGVITHVPSDEELSAWYSKPPVSTEGNINQHPGMNEEGVITHVPSDEELSAWYSKPPADDKSHKESILGEKGIFRKRFVADDSVADNFYGNEKERFKALKRMSLKTFKEHLTAINKQVRKSGVDDAEGTHGIVNGVRISANRHRTSHVFPAIEDIDKVLDFALTKAKNANNIQDAALILSLGFVSAHPFAEGNGRTSRALYAELSAGINPSSVGYELATASTSMSKDEEGGSGMIWLGGVIKREPELSKIHNELIFERVGLTPYATNLAEIDYDREPESNEMYGLPEKALEDLSKNDKLRLNEAFDILRGLTYERRLAGNAGEDLSFSFALSYIDKKYPGILDSYIINNEGYASLSIHRLFHEGDKFTISKLLEGLKTYDTLYAMADIEMIAKGSKMLMSRGHQSGTISVKDRIIELSNNFLAEKIGNRDKSLSKKLGKE